MPAVAVAVAEQDHLSLFASRLSRHSFGDDDLRLLEAALSAGADVPALLATRSAARRLLQDRATEAFAATPLDHERSLAIADFFARAFALVADVQAFACAGAHIHRSHPGQLGSTNSIDKDKINDIIGLQNLAKSLSAQHSVQTQSAEYMTRKASGVHDKYNLQPGKPKLPGSSMFRLGIKTRNTKKLLCSRERNLG
ncbi:unnamed protein product [Urochloa humidicola]